MRLSSATVLAVPLLAASLLAFACTSPPTGLDESNATSKKKGSSEDSEDPNKITTTGLPCDVSEVLTQKCQTCHGTEPKTGASVPLVTWDDLNKEKNGQKVYDLVKARVHAATKPMPPADKLDATALDAIDKWVAGGAEKSDASCKTGTAPPATRKFECAAPNKVTLLKATAPFTWTETSKSDEYVCYGVDEVMASKKHIIAMGPMIDNLSIVHHVLLFQSNDPMPQEAKPCQALAAAGWKMVTGWAPGGGNFELPPEAGFPAEGTTHWILQVHYNNAKQLKGQSDQSGYQLCETDQLRPNDAGVLAFGSMDFTIPPRIPNFSVTCDYKLDERYTGVHFFGATPHMHTMGTSIQTERLPGGTGAPEMMFAQNPFVFENQSNFKLEGKVANPGDVMRTTCNWKNTTDHEINFGENTSDEMCFNFFAYYPAIPDKMLGPVPLQSWSTPSLHLPLLGGPDCTTSQ